MGEIASGFIQGMGQNSQGFQRMGDIYLQKKEQDRGYEMGKERIGIEKERAGYEGKRVKLDEMMAPFMRTLYQQQARNIGAQAGTTEAGIAHAGRRAAGEADVAEAQGAASIAEAEFAPATARTRLNLMKQGEKKGEQDVARGEMELTATPRDIRDRQEAAKLSNRATQLTGDKMWAELSSMPTMEEIRQTRSLALEQARNGNQTAALELLTKEMDLWLSVNGIEPGARSEIAKQGAAHKLAAITKLLTDTGMDSLKGDALNERLAAIDVKFNEWADQAAESLGGLGLSLEEAADISGTRDQGSLKRALERFSKTRAGRK